MGMSAAMLMVRDSILADERNSGAEDDLLRKTKTEEGKEVTEGSGKKGRQRDFYGEKPRVLWAFSGEILPQV